MAQVSIIKAICVVLLFALGCSRGPKANERRPPHDRRLDSPEQVRLRSECPQRKYPKYRKIYKWPPDPPNKQTLLGFLGCRFGERTSGRPPERYVRLSEPFFGFRWVRHDTCPGYNVIVRCDARMTFVSDEKSSVPFRRIKALRDEFKVKYDASTWDETETESDYHAMTQVDGEYRIELFVRATRRSFFRSRPIVYEIGFEIVNERHLPDYIGIAITQPVANWHGVLHETLVSAADAENEAAWTYEVGSGKTLEEILQDWVRDRNENGHKVGKPFDINKLDCIGSDNTAVVCPEWDADDYSARLGSFVKYVNSKALTRIQDMLYHPEYFKEGKRTKTGDFQVGHIYGELIPGDRVRWYGPNWQKSGVVCNEGEDGEWWDCIGRKMKSVSTNVFPAGGSLQPTEKERTYVRKMNDLHIKKLEARSRVCAQLGHEIDFSTNGLASVTNFLHTCLTEQRPGFYVGIHERKWLSLQAETKELTQKIIEKREQLRVNDYQYDLDCCRSDILSLLKHERIPERTARGFRLSRYELVKLRDWDRCEAYEEIVKRHEIFPEKLVLRHRLFCEKPVSISQEELPAVIENVSAFSNRKLSDTDAERAVLELYEVLIRAFESPDDILERVLPVCGEVMSANCDKLVMRLLFARLGVEYKDEAKALAFLKQVYLESDKRRSGFMTPNWMKEMQRMLEFDWSGH